MAYDKAEIFKKAQTKIKNKSIYFIEDIVSLLPCSRSTFYSYFPEGSDELDTLKELLEQNRVNAKVKMRKKWHVSDNPTLQVALMKIIATDDEAHRLNGSKQEVKHGNDPDNPIKNEIAIYMPDNGRDTKS